MATIPTELEAVVMSLPRDERAELARRLIASLDDDDEVAAAWLMKFGRGCARIAQAR